MEPELTMPSMGARPPRDVVRRSNNRFMMAMSLLMVGGTAYYIWSKRQPKSQSFVYVGPKNSSGPKPHYMRYSDYPNASSSNNKGINNTMNGRVREVTVERSGGGI
ncbi:hypothetical protein V1508DRAFT_464272 [Lipomyces doorenjongii]|uniref:uncharacterized protein n=1 Tax=Lipomyces doorenjongii TaxID=383834 RepID=UPI0034CF9111